MCGDSHSTCGRQYNNVLIAATKAQAKDFLRLSQRELSSVLEMLEREYTAIVLDLAGMARAKLLKVVRGMVKQVELQPLPEDWENRVGKTLSNFRIYPLTPF
jgi:MinD-like ATPase involved in chromosome partitioning or flagellar assembly